MVKLDASLKIEWSQDYGLSTGQDQCFDILVDGSVKTSSVETDDLGPGINFHFGVHS